jgi:hypothetical protein
MQISLSEAMELFSSRTSILSLRITDRCREGRQITARLSQSYAECQHVECVHAGCHMSTWCRRAECDPTIRSCGKRGYRIRAAELDALSVEAREDAVRQLGLHSRIAIFECSGSAGICPSTNAP